MGHGNALDRLLLFGPPRAFAQSRGWRRERRTLAGPAFAIGLLHTNVAGSDLSDSATLVVNLVPPSVTGQPVSSRPS